MLKNRKKLYLLKLAPNLNDIVLEILIDTIFLLNRRFIDDK